MTTILFWKKTIQMIFQLQVIPVPSLFGHLILHLFYGTFYFIDLFLNWQFTVNFNAIFNSNFNISTSKIILTKLCFMSIREKSWFTLAIAHGMIQYTLTTFYPFWSTIHMFSVAF